MPLIIIIIIIIIIMAVALFSSGSVVISYIFPVLWMTS